MQLKPVEKLLVGLTRSPWHALYLIPTGFFAARVAGWLFGDTASGWAWGGVLAAILFGVRFAAAVVRRFVPVSKEAQEAWRQARVLGKRYDSYQWRKLFWVGLGLGLQWKLSARLPDVQMALALACLIGGASGAMWWQFVLRQGTVVARHR